MTVCENNKCTGCMACMNVCSKNAISIEDTLDSYNAIIDKDKCINCNECIKVCQQNGIPELTTPQKWDQGWANDEKIREKASSGGLATAISVSFIRNGGYVYGCTFNKGKFVFDKATTEEELKRFVGSKYVKSNSQEAYSLIKDDLAKNKNVLFIGLPCQVAGLKKIIGKSITQNLFTIDLICHGTPSPKLLEIFLNQYSVNLKNLKDIQFRKKAKFQIYEGYKGIITNGVCDKYSIAFLNSLSYTENCYSCNYAKIDRVSDLTLGDSWGSNLSISEQKKGISLALCQTKKGSQLLEQANITTENVDIDIAVKCNHQLSHPSVMQKNREKFFKQLKTGKKFNNSVFKAFPKKCLKQDVKHLLIKLGLLSGARKIDYVIIRLLRR